MPRMNLGLMDLKTWRFYVVLAHVLRSFFERTRLHSRNANADQKGFQFDGGVLVATPCGVEAGGATASFKP